MSVCSHLRTSASLTNYYWQKTRVQVEAMRKAKRVFLIPQSKYSRDADSRRGEGGKRSAEVLPACSPEQRRREINFRAEQVIGVIIQLLDRAAPLAGPARSCALWTPPLLKSSSSNTAFTLNNHNPPMRPRLWTSEVGGVNQ